jgi:DNA-binding CsgD family transcriptional regulator
MLTPREIEVLHHLSRGLSYAEVGVALGVSLNTVTSHVKNTYRKLEVHTAAAAVMRAVELELLGQA